MFVTPSMNELDFLVWLLTLAYISCPFPIRDEE